MNIVLTIVCLTAIGFLAIIVPATLCMLFLSYIKDFNATLVKLTEIRSNEKVPFLLPDLGGGGLPLGKLMGNRGQSGENCQDNKVEDDDRPDHHKGYV